MKNIYSFVLITCFLFSVSVKAQSWQDVGGGASNSSHALLTYNGKLINLGSFNNVPCDRVAEWDGTSWTCLSGGVGIVARAGVVWNGKLVVVGDFWNNFQPCVGCNGVAVWDGTTWSALDQGFNNDVLSCTVFNGDLIIGGDFTQANGVPISRVAKWNPTTLTFESMGTAASFDNDVRCMTEFNGELYVGGDFNNVDGNSPYDGLVKWDSVAQEWVGGNLGVDLVGGVNETVRVLYVNPNDGNLYMGGHFPELIDGDSINPDYNMSGVAMYDGLNWFPLGTGLNDYCRAIHEYNGNLIVGGYFTTADGVFCNRIAKWIPSIGSYAPMGLGFDGVGIDEYVKSMTTWNGILFAGGAYTQAEGNPMNYIAQWYESPTSSPTAVITPSVSTICETSCINFVDNSTNSPTSWLWTFTGASTLASSAQNPINICYPTNGSFTAKLVTCNGNGCDSATVNITVGGVSVVNPVALIGCDSLQYDNVMYYSSIMITDTSFVGSVNGCDSITNQQITVTSSIVMNQTPVVACDSAQVNGIWYFSSQTVSDFYSGGSSVSCDSTDVTVLTITNSVVVNQPSVVACDSAQINGVWYFSSQTVSDFYSGGSSISCDSTDITVLTINSVDETVTVTGNVITANLAGAVYQWLDCNNGYAIISGEISQTFVATSNGDYAVVVIQNGCVDTSSCVNIIITGINISETLNEVIIYPNPTYGEMKIECNSAIEEIYLISLTGKILKSFNSKSSKINISDLPKGIYFLKIKVAGGIITKKIIKE